MLICAEVFMILLTVVLTETAAIEDMDEDEQEPLVWEELDIPWLEEDMELDALEEDELDPCEEEEDVVVAESAPLLNLKS